MQNKTVIIIAAIVGGTLLSIMCCCGIGAVLVLPKVREAAERQVRQNDLKQLGMAVHSFISTTNKMPGNTADVAPFLVGSPIEGRIQSGEIQVVWDALPIAEQVEGSSNVLIAWETKTEPNGQRAVLFLDGSARMLSEDEFQKTPKARTQAK